MSLCGSICKLDYWYPNIEALFKLKLLKDKGKFYFRKGYSTLPFEIVPLKNLLQQNILFNARFEAIRMPLTCKPLNR